MAVERERWTFLDTKKARQGGIGKGVIGVAGWRGVIC